MHTKESIDKNYFINLGMKINNYLEIDPSIPTFIFEDGGSYYISFKDRAHAEKFSQFLAQNGMPGRNGNKLVQWKKRHPVLYLTPDQLRRTNDLLDGLLSKPSEKEPYTWSKWIDSLHEKHPTAESSLSLDNPALKQQPGNMLSPSNSGASFPFFGNKQPSNPSPLAPFNDQAGNKTPVLLNNENAKNIIQSAEQSVGKFSNYKTSAGAGQDIPFSKKPAQQFLHQAFGVSDDNPWALLSQTSTGEPIPRQNNRSVTITSFDPNQKVELTVTGELIDELVNSAKVYVNTDIFKPGGYENAMGHVEFEPQTKKKLGEDYYANLAVGLCLTQKVVLLVTQVPMNQSNGLAILMPKAGIIDKGKPTITLLSTPALNFAPNVGVAQHLNGEKQKTYIQGMYRILFHSALREGCQFITMPAAGLGVFKGDPKLYFSALMEVAKEFPALNIIYNPAQYSGEFDGYLMKEAPKNIFKTDRDVLVFADVLTQQGHSCAYHNPSDVDVMFGVQDVGQYWKYGKNTKYVGEEHNASMTTAPLNSYKLNPAAYKTIIECSFAKKESKELDSSQHAKTGSQHFGSIF